MKKLKTYCTLLLALLVTAQLAAMPADSLFLQPVSLKYKTSGELEGSTLKKVVVDFNDNVFVLTDKGLGRISDNLLVKTRLYRPLMDKNPVDITIQENTGHLYYLYNDNFLTNEEAGVPYGKLPENTFDKIAVNAEGAVLLAGKGKLALFQKGVLKDVPAPQDALTELKAIAGNYYALGAQGVYHVDASGTKLIHKAANLASFAINGQNLVLGSNAGYYTVNLATGASVEPLQQKIPVTQISKVLVAGNDVWLGTENGAFTKNAEGGYRYFASKRWLDNNKVNDMATDGQGTIYLVSPTGLNAIKFIKQTYGEKAEYFEKKIRERHIRYGLLAELRLKSPGDLASAEMVDTDNDGLWTSFYLGAMALKYAVNGDPSALRYVWESFGAYERLLSVNQLKGFPSRTFERKGFKVSDPHAWRASPDSGWEWKGTTSSDEFVGYIFIASLMDQLIAKNNNDKQRVATFMDKILNHIITNKYNFIDLDGKPTLWGRWHPDYVNWYANTISDRKLGSVDLIAGLQIGYGLTKKNIYKKEAERLMNKHGYLDNIMISPYNIKATPNHIYRGHDMGMGPWNHSDDEMEFLSFWPLYHYAFSDDLKNKYAKAIAEYNEIELPERHPAWNLITLGTAGAGNFDKESTLWYLREYPMDLVRWTVKNSHRKDLEFMEPNFRSQFTKTVLSPAERPINRFNSNEFELDGGSDGREELTGAEYLFSYWLARYLNVIK